MEIFPPKKIKIVEIENKGRGVVATEKILKNEIIEHCAVIVLGERDLAFIENKDKTDTLYHYYLYQPEFKRNIIMLGYGSLYNHSFEPNAEVDYEDDPKIKQIYFRAIKDIEKGEEIIFNYSFDNDIVEFLPNEK